VSARCAEERNVNAATGLDTVPSEAPQEGVVLGTWLTLLGWQVEFAQVSELHVGVARHITAEGDELVIGACTASRSETLWQLFEGVIDVLPAGVDRLGRDFVDLPRSP
jgi:hypothetical protein